MDTQADTGTITDRAPADERVRTCQPAVMRRGADNGCHSDSKPSEENIVRGED